MISIKWINTSVRRFNSRINLWTRRIDKEKLLSSWGHFLIEIIFYETVFILVDSVLSIDSFLIGLIALFMPILYRSLKNIYDIRNDKVLIFSLLYFSGLIILGLHRARLTNPNDISFNFMMFFIVWILLQGVFEIVFDFFKNLSNNTVKVAFLTFFSIMVILVAVFHIHILKFSMEFIR